MNWHLGTRIEQTRQIQNFFNEYFEAAAFDFPFVFTVLASQQMDLSNKFESIVKNA